MQISTKVLKVLTEEKISAEELYHMMTEAAFTSLRGCNLRYFQWLFTRQGDLLMDMQRAEVVEIGRGQNRMLEEHDACNGEGCRTCGWTGSVSRAIADSTAALLTNAR